LNQTDFSAVVGSLEPSKIGQICAKWSQQQDIDGNRSRSVHVARVGVARQVAREQTSASIASISPIQGDVYVKRDQ
jgi:hypothetical protein